MQTFTKHYLRILAIAATLWCAPVHAAWQYTAVDFPSDEVIFTQLWGVNDSGDAVGFAFDVLSDVLIHPFAFVYDIHKGTYTRLPRAFGEEFGTLGFGINNRGAVAGVRFAPPDGGGPRRDTQQAGRVHGIRPSRLAVSHRCARDQ